MPAARTRSSHGSTRPVARRTSPTWAAPAPTRPSTSRSTRRAPRTSPGRRAPSDFPVASPLQTAHSAPAHARCVRLQARSRRRRARLLDVPRRLRRRRRGHRGRRIRRGVRGRHDELGRLPGRQTVRRCLRSGPADRLPHPDRPRRRVVRVLDAEPSGARPIGVAVDGTGYAYVAEYLSNLRITKYPLDVEPPETTIAPLPPRRPTTNVAQFTFDSSEPGPRASFECRLDGSSWSACTSPKTTRSSPTAPTRSKCARSTRRATSIRIPPPTPGRSTPTRRTRYQSPIPPAVTNATATFTFTSSQDPRDVRVQIDAGSYTPCTSPATFGNLTGGPHTFRVRATEGGQTDVSPAEFTWNVDVTPPNTFITQSPLEGSTATVDRDVRVRLDRHRRVARVPAGQRGLRPVHVADDLSGLADGAHVFAVRSTDAVGNVDPPARTATGHVETSRPDTTIVTRPHGADRHGHRVVAFTASEPATFECSLDGRPPPRAHRPSCCTALSEGLALPSPSGRSTSRARWTRRLRPRRGPWTSRHRPRSRSQAPPTGAAQPARLARVRVGRDERRHHRRSIATSCGSTGGWIAPCPRGVPDRVFGGPVGALGRRWPHSWQVRAVDRRGNAGRRRRGRSASSHPADALRTPVPADGAAVATARPVLSWDAATDAGAGVAAYDVRVDGNRSARRRRPRRASHCRSRSRRAPRLAGRRARRQRQRAADRDARFTVDLTPPGAAFTAAPNPALTGPRGDVRRRRLHRRRRRAWPATSGTSTATVTSSATTGATRQHDLDLSEPGTYGVRLRVTDRAGLSAVARMSQRDQRQRQGPRARASRSTTGPSSRTTRTSSIGAVWPSFAAAMLVSNDGGFRAPRTFPLAARTPWKLEPTGAERSPRIVYVRFIRGRPSARRTPTTSSSTSARRR